MPRDWIPFAPLDDVLPNTRHGAVIEGVISKLRDELVQPTQSIVQMPQVRIEQADSTAPHPFPGEGPCEDRRTLALVRRSPPY